jgi:hypothetical protein
MNDVYYCDGIECRKFQDYPMEITITYGLPHYAAYRKDGGVQGITLHFCCDKCMDEWIQKKRPQIKAARIKKEGEDRMRYEKERMEDKLASMEPSSQP